MKQKTIFVGLSGGVDSSVAALRLKNQGYDAVGVFIKVWHPDFIDCNWEEERLDAMRVAAHLDIPFLMCDAEQAYKQEVADYFIAEYQAGRTPNPDVMCNQAVKFGAFLEFARKRGADFIATGHYAQNIDLKRSDLLHTQRSDLSTVGEGGNRFQLLRGADVNKDQSYFLWTLTQEQLAQSLFPVGDTTKEQIRQEAEAAGLPVAAKKDSQGICFLGQIDIPNFLSHFISITPGAVLDHSGTVIGTHQGALVYAHGQRHGFTITTKTTHETPHYVVAKDLEHNTITVNPKPPMAPQTDTIKLSNVNWIPKSPPTGTVLAAQTRYRQTPFSVTLTDVTETTTVLQPDDPHEIASPGQSCVLYEGAQCVGGGIIA